MEYYEVARWRFTWKNRTIPRGDSRVLALGPTKDQTADPVRDRCRCYSLCKVLEDHIRLNFNIDVEISIVDLEKDTQSYGNVKHACNTVWKTCDFLKETGALALGFEENDTGAEVRFKLKGYEPLPMDDFKGISRAIGKYMTKGPMVGVFSIHGDDMDNYADTEPDEIYFVSKQKPRVGTHCVALPGFGMVSTFPFWHFENTYGGDWRGPARGFGQLYAPHLKELYGVELDERAPFV